MSMRPERTGTSRELERLATLPRGDDELRVGLDEFVSPEGKVSRYVSVRLWFVDGEGAWRPTRKGITVRRAELAEVRDALDRAIDAIDERPPTDTRRERAQDAQRRPLGGPEPGSEDTW